MFAVFILRNNAPRLIVFGYVKDERRKSVRGKKVKKANPVKNNILFYVIQYRDLFSDNAQKAEHKN